MKQIAALSLALTLTALPATAQQTDDGVDLMQKGAEMLLRGLMDEMEPAIKDLRGMMDEFGPAMQMFADEMGPVLLELLRRTDDLRNYEKPEILPNGDIIIRRSPDAPPWETPDADTGEIEL